MIRIFFTLLMIYAFAQAFALRDPDPEEGKMVPLPSKTLGRFETAEAARHCGAILGRVVRCNLPRDDRNRLIEYCAGGLGDGSGGVNHRLYEVFLDGTGDGERNLHGWSCDRVEKTLASPLLPSRYGRFD